MKKGNAQKNPTSNQSIAFFCTNAYHIYVVKNVARYLPGSIVLIGGKYQEELEGEWKERTNKAVRLCEKYGILYQRIPFTIHPDLQSDIFNSYNLIVSVSAGFLPSNLSPRIKLVKIEYGPGKDLEIYGVNNRIFDLILAHGVYSKERLKTYSPCIVVGYPKFDDWFSGEISTERLKKLIDPAKKTVLYLPTHGKLSSLQFFIEKISGLVSSFNIITKFHHETVRQQPNILKEHYFQNAIVFDEMQDILELFSISDVVLCDSGGSVLEALLADKPTVILDLNGAERFNELPSPINNFRSRVSYAHSIDEIIKLSGNQICSVANSLEGIGDLIDTAAGIHKERAGKRLKVLKSLFAHRDGKDGKRAAKAIQSQLIKPKSPPSLLRLAIDEALTSAIKRTRYLETRKKMRNLEKFHKMPTLHKIKHIAPKLL